jgi:5-methylcytosine-specific restriction endonuclease McrA
MGRKLPRNCPKCREEVMWEKVRPEGAHRSIFRCLQCGAATKPLSGRRKASMRTPAQKSYRRKVKEANELWRHLIYKKARDLECAVCGTRRGLQAMHLFPKGKYPHLRFDLANGAPGCPGCHIRLTNDHEAHRNFCILFLGADEYEALRLRSISKEKMNIDAIMVELRRLTDEGDTEG